RAYRTYEPRAAVAAPYHSAASPGPRDSHCAFARCVDFPFGMGGEASLPPSLTSRSAQELYHARAVDLSEFPPMPQASHKRDPVAPTPPPIDVPVLMLQARTALRQTVHVALRSVDQIGR